MKGMVEMKRIVMLALALVLCATLALGAVAEETFEATAYVEINIENYGTITAELYGNDAPITVENFLKLVNEGFYDGLTFHRIISGFMIQGGDPLGNGTGGSGEAIKGEFAQNGVENNIAHTRGTLSMARTNDPNSATSQFTSCTRPPNIWTAVTPRLAA